MIRNQRDGSPGRIGCNLSVIRDRRRRARRAAVPTRDLPIVFDRARWCVCTYTGFKAHRARRRSVLSWICFPADLAVVPHTASCTYVDATALNLSASRDIQGVHVLRAATRHNHSFAWGDAYVVVGPRNASRVPVIAILPVARIGPECLCSCDLERPERQSHQDPCNRDPSAPSEFHRIRTCSIGHSTHLPARADQASSGCSLPLRFPWGSALTHSDPFGPDRLARHRSVGEAQRHPIWVLASGRFTALARI